MVSSLLATSGKFFLRRLCVRVCIGKVCMLPYDHMSKSVMVDQQKYGKLIINPWETLCVYYTGPHTLKCKDET